MSSSVRLLKAARLTHLYLGVFIAPALLFFAFTGAIQTFSLHETTRGSDYKPPRILVILAQIHKKQTPLVPVRKASPFPDAAAPKDPAAPKSDKHPDATTASPAATKAPAPAPADQPRPHNALPLKIFFLAVSIGLFLSTLTGIYMAYKYTRNKTLITVLLVLGIVIPVLLAVV